MIDGMAFWNREYVIEDGSGCVSMASGGSKLD